MFLRRWALLALGLAVFAFPSASFAQQSDWASNDFGKVRLIAASAAVEEDGAVRLGLHIIPKPGWKLYWRSPGDAGYPPKIDWSGSVNLASAEMLWPAPHRFATGGLDTIGYEGELVLPILARAQSLGEPLILNAAVDYLTCDVLCAPVSAQLKLTLDVGPPASSPHAGLIGRFMDLVPKAPEATGFALSRIGFDKDGLAVDIIADPSASAPDLFIESADGLYFAAPALRLEQNGRLMQFRAPLLSGADNAAAIAGRNVTLTLVDGPRSAEIGATIGSATLPPLAAPDFFEGSLWLMIGVALLGGLILNVMPCVLPVLSIKIFSVLQKGGAERSHIRGGFLASAAGIVVSFLGLALLLIGLKSAGAAIGWGIQFQQPLFLTAMIVILCLFAANLWGFFELSLPGFLGNLASPTSEGRIGHFGEGVLATLLATPCSAPLVGAALGFALAQGPVEILAIFAALGVGMSLPHLLFAAFPALIQFLPKPGAWMIKARFLLGGTLLGTALWLLYVLAHNQTMDVAVLLASFMAALLALLALKDRLPATARKTGAILLCAAALFAVGWSDAALQSLVPETAETDAPTPGQIAWRPFIPDAIKEEIASGKVVLVDITADWCLTCKLNDRTVFRQDRIIAAVNVPTITAFRGDWTRADENYSRFMAQHGRYALPFNAVFGPNAPQGILLPELLSSDIVMDALEKAAGPKEQR